MRIVSGRFKGMAIAVPKTGDIRPTQDRARESLFAVLAPELAGATFADLFAGSGAAGIEALSRGAAKAVFVERDRRHAAAIGKNLEEARRRGLDEGAAHIAVRDAFAWAADGGGTRAGIVFADPPYALGEERAEQRLMDALAASGALAPGGLFVFETGARGGEARPSRGAWDLLREREYGASRIRIWRLTANGGNAANREEA